MIKTTPKTYLLFLFVGILIFVPYFSSIDQAFSHNHNFPYSKHTDLANHLEHSISFYSESLYAFEESKEKLVSSFFIISIGFSSTHHFKNSFISYFWHPPKTIS